VVHLAATGFATFSLSYAARPPDVNHLYGHGRIAYLSAGFEGALVLAAGLAVIGSGAVSLLRGPQLQRLELGLAISGIVAAINLAVGVSLLVVGRRYHTFILIANGKHVLTDVWTTVAAIAGLGLVLWTGLTWIDGLVALVLGLVIVGSGGSLLRRSLAGLMDEVDQAFTGRLRDVLGGGVRDGVISDYHHLRCRQSDDQVWVDVHLLVPGELSTLEAHARATAIEQAMQRAFPELRLNVTTHIEPRDHARAHPGGHVGAPDAFPVAAAAAGSRSSSSVP
jgi:cation diffusion facilitator family transporter